MNVQRRTRSFLIASVYQLSLAIYLLNLQVICSPSLIGPMITYLVSQKSKYVDTFYLAFRILNQRFEKGKGSIAVYSRILQLTSFISIIDPELEALVIKQIFPQMPTDFNVKLSELLLILNIIQHNTQRFPISKLAGSSIMCLLPILSRINHSCKPNVILINRSSFDSSNKVLVEVVTIRPIQVDEELTM